MVFELPNPGELYKTKVPFGMYNCSLEDYLTGDDYWRRKENIENQKDGIVMVIETFGPDENNYFSLFALAGEHYGIISFYRFEQVEQFLVKC